MVARATLAGYKAAIGALLVDGIIPPEADVTARADFLVRPLPLLLLLLLLSLYDTHHLVQFRLDAVGALLLKLLAVFLVRFPVGSLASR